MQQESRTTFSNYPILFRASSDEELQLTKLTFSYNLLIGNGANRFLLNLLFHTMPCHDGIDSGLATSISPMAGSQ